jgi:hypothetical protein
MRPPAELPAPAVTCLGLERSRIFIESVEENTCPAKRILLFALGSRQGGFDGGKGIGAARPRFDQRLTDLGVEPHLVVDRLAAGMKVAGAQRVEQRRVV